MTRNFDRFFVCLLAAVATALASCASPPVASVPSPGPAQRSPSSQSAAPARPVIQETAPTGVSLDEAIAQAARDISGKLPAGVSLAVAGFSSPATAFSGYVEDELTAALVNTRRLVVVDRANLDTIKREQTLGLSPDLDEDTAQRIGHILGAQLLLTGRLTRAGASYRMALQAFNAETAVVAAAYTADIRDDARMSALLSMKDPPVLRPAPLPAPPNKPFSPDEFGGVWSGTVAYTAGGVTFRDAYSISLFADRTCFVTVRAEDGKAQAGEGYWGAEDGVFELECEFANPAIARLARVKWVNVYALQADNRHLRININPAPGYSGVVGITLNKGK